MSAAEHATEDPHVVLIGGRLYGSGDTRRQAITDFRAQIAGGTPAMRASMAERATIVAVSAEHASEVAEMRDAVAIAWSGTICRDTASTDEEDEETRFLNFYDCPCGESWSSKDDCACDDRCPTCRTSCSPTRSEDASAKPGVRRTHPSNPEAIMRDRALLRTTLTLIRTAGSQAHLVRDPSLGFIWRAGSLVLPGAGLNDQAVRDLIDDGWLQKDCIAGTATLDCWPTWTGEPDPAAHCAP